MERMILSCYGAASLMIAGGLIGAMSTGTIHRSWRRPIGKASEWVILAGAVVLVLAYLADSQQWGR